MDFDMDYLLWHYTSFDVLQEFLKDNSCLYATHYRFLNDNLEGIYNHAKIFDYITEDKKYSGWLKHFKAYIEKADFYIFCFSRSSDNLYQWRSYTPEGGGVAIAFSAKEISNQLHNEIESQLNANIAYYGIEDLHKIPLANLEKCQYANTTDNFTHFVEGFEHFKQIAIDDPNAEEVIFSCLLNHLRLNSTTIKDPSFAFEEEERIVYSAGNLRSKMQMIGQKPRIPTCIDNVRKYIKEVKISPHGDRTRNKLLVELLKDKYKLSFPITESSSSYNGKS